MLNTELISYVSLIFHLVIRPNRLTNYSTPLSILGFRLSTAAVSTIYDSLSTLVINSAELTASLIQHWRVSWISSYDRSDKAVAGSGGSGSSTRVFKQSSDFRRPTSDLLGPAASAALPLNAQLLATRPAVASCEGGSTAPYGCPAVSSAKAIIAPERTAIATVTKITSPRSCWLRFCPRPSAGQSRKWDFRDRR